MKLFQIVSVLVAIVSVVHLSPAALAEIQFYGVDAELSPDGTSKIKLTITFQEAVKNFQLVVYGNLMNLESKSNAGPTVCDLATGVPTIVDCQLDLTEDKRTLELKFETSDFVTLVEGKQLFSLDLSLSELIRSASASVKLPEGYALTNTTSIPPYSPPTPNILSDGRRIIVNWEMKNLTVDQRFRFQTLYEPVKGQFPVTWISSALFSLLIIGGIGVFFYRRLRKPKEIILSVLDDFERKVIEVITNAGGEINQRKVVTETNLSKAKVSRVVKRLQERGLIQAIRLGRTNKLKLVKEKFKES